jgi:hypothetical protein
MAQTSDTLSHPIALDYDSTLVLAIELSNTSWVLAAQVPGLPRVKAKQSIEPTAEALLAAVDGYRDRAKAAGKTVQRVVATYEASWSGFWLARWLARRGVETHVVQPSSIPVDRRARRAKSDGIDAELLLRTLLAWLRGEPRVCSMVPIPDEADEDERRRVREREDLVAERVSLDGDAVQQRGHGARARDRQSRQPAFANRDDRVGLALATLPARLGSGHLVSRARWRHGKAHAQGHGGGDGTAASDRLVAVRDPGRGTRGRGDEARVLIDFAN